MMLVLLLLVIEFENLDHPMKQREAPHRYFQISKVLRGEISSATSDMVVGGDFSLVFPSERNDSLQLVA